MSRNSVFIGAVLVIGLANQFSSAGDTFEKPVRLIADGKVTDTGAAWGHSSPCVEDLDGDGLPDLLVGDFSGKFRVYKNVGEKNKPAYKDAGNLQAGGEDAAVRIYCCVGGQPRFVDLDGDGIRDFVSSSYDPGYCYFFRGLANHKFAKPEELVDKTKTPVRSTPVQKQDFQSFGSFYCPVDWDADGDFDMLIGCFQGELKLRINEGDAKTFSFAGENIAVEADGKPVKVEKHCCPVVADWDADGKWDILAGSDDGSVTWFKNIGTKESPKFEKGVTLIQKADNVGYNLLLFGENDVVPGIRSQIDVVDYNDDGKLDLLLGDFCTAYDPKRDLTDEQKQELRKIIRDFEQTGTNPFAAKMQALRKDFAERYPGDEFYSDKATEEWSKAYQELRKSPEAKEMEQKETEFARKIKPFLASTSGEGERSFDLAKSHGYVWVFIRK
jgi:hypothetical protein